MREHSHGRFGGSSIHTHRVGELDVLYADTGFWLVVGPVRPTDDARLAQALDRLAAGGPEHRVGLVPSRNGRQWRFETDPGAAAVLPPCPVECEDVDQLLQNAVRMRPETPIAVARCGDYLCVYLNHGVGDSRVFHRIVAALAGSATGVELDADPSKLCRHPFGLALWTACRTRPLQLLADTARLSKVAASRARTFAMAAVEKRRAASIGDAPAPIAADEAPIAIFVSSAPTYRNDLVTHRDSANPSVSIAAMIIFAICKSLQDVGVDVSAVEVLTDLRRFLPERTTTFANFISVVTVPLSKRTTLEEISADLKGEVRSYRPLIKLMASLGLSKIRHAPGRARIMSEPTPVRSSKTIVVVTEFARPSAAAKIPWAEPASSVFAVAGEPPSTQYIHINLTSSGDNRVQLTARFYESHVDPQMVRVALGRAVSSAFPDFLESREVRAV
jgi:hypothetical protein